MMSVFSISIALIHILLLIPVEAHDRGRNGNDPSSVGDAGDNSASAAVAADYARLESIFNQPLMNLVPISLDQHSPKPTAASTAPSTHASTSAPGDYSTSAQLPRTTGSTSAGLTTTANTLGLPTGTGVGGSSGLLQYPTGGGRYHNTSPSGSAPSSGSTGGLPYQTQGAPYLNGSLPWNGGSGGSLAIGTASGLQPSMQPSGGSGPNSLGKACPPVQTVTLPASTITLPAETVTVTAQAQQQITPQTLTTTVTTTVTITKDGGCHCPIPTGHPAPNPASALLYPIASGPNIPNSAGLGGPAIPAGSQPAKTLPNPASQIGTGSILKNPPLETGGNGNSHPSSEGPGTFMSQSNQGGLSPSSVGIAQPASGGPQVPHTPGTQPSQGGATNLPQFPASHAPFTAPYGNATGSNTIIPTGSGASGSGGPTAGSKGSGRLPLPSSLVSPYPLQGTKASLAPFSAPGNGTKGVMSPTGTGIALKPGASASYSIPGGGSLPGFSTGSQRSTGFATASNGNVPSLATGVQGPSAPTYPPLSNTTSTLNDTGSSPMSSPCPEKSSSSPTNAQQTSLSPLAPDLSTSMIPSITGSSPASPASAAPQISSSTCFSNHTSLQSGTATFDELVTLQLTSPSVDGSGGALVYQGLNFTTFKSFNSNAAASAPNMLLAPASSSPKVITTSGGAETSLSISELWLACVKSDVPGATTMKKKKRSRLSRWGLLEGRAMQAQGDENAVGGQDCSVTITGAQAPSTSAQTPSRAGFLSVSIPASQKGMKQVKLAAFANMNEVRFAAQMGGQPCGVGIDNVSYEIWSKC